MDKKHEGSFNPKAMMDEESLDRLANMVKMIKDHPEDKELTEKWGEVRDEHLESFKETTKLTMQMAVLARPQCDAKYLTELSKLAISILSTINPCFVYAGLNPTITDEEADKGFQTAMAISGQCDEMPVNEHALTLVTMLGDAFARSFGNEDGSISEEQLGYDIIAHGLGFMVFKLNGLSRTVFGGKKAKRDIINDYLNVADNEEMGEDGDHNIIKVFGKESKKQIEDLESYKTGETKIPKVKDAPYRSPDGLLRAFTVQGDNKEDLQKIQETMYKAMGGNVTKASSLKPAAQRVVKEVLNSVDLSKPEMIAETKKGSAVMGVTLNPAQARSLLMALGIDLDEINLDGIRVSVASVEQLAKLAKEGEKDVEVVSEKIQVDPDKKKDDKKKKEGEGEDK